MYTPEIDALLQQLAQAWVERFRGHAADNVADGYPGTYQQFLEEAALRHLHDENLLGDLEHLIKEIAQQARM